MDGFAEANLLLTTALEQLDDILKNDIDNGNADDERSSKENCTRTWITTEWKGRAEFSSDGSSGVESPPSDLPTSSSSVFNPPRIYQDFVKAIDEHMITERPDLETRLKIMQWVAGRTLIDIITQFAVAPYGVK
ncbi:unnamed protein product [Caenorhabditis bovis]|uniref:Uncharacterized protein n=1 Tax=Caenorhabditis bovis TaxID=2654633 RepID=A0A8S1ELH9_9PELO|nr:unnamed protein product [Caenorhabditis bovis]